jgi:hypothetical protein
MPVTNLTEQRGEKQSSRGKGTSVARENKKARLALRVSLF